MNLKLIKDEKCPTCGSEIVMESCKRTHTNGEGFEERMFKCGCILTWSPNFSRLETRNTCPKNPNLIEFNRKREEAKKAVKEYINTLDVDSSWKDQIKHSAFLD